MFCEKIPEYSCVCQCACACVCVCVCVCGLLLLGTVKGRKSHDCRDDSMSMMT